MAMSEDVRIVREALEYQERESLVGPLFPEALDALARLEARIEELEEACRLLNGSLDTYVPRAEAAEALLKKIRQWDMLDVAADGPYWKRTIDEYFGEV